MATKYVPSWEIAAKWLVAIRYGTYEQCGQMLLAGADTDETFKINTVLKPALHIAVERGSIDIVEMLLNSGCAVDRRDSEGRTALQIAIESGYEHIAQLLLFHRADVNLRDDQGRCPLHYSVKHGSISISKLLIQKGADISRRDQLGYTPLSYLSSNAGANFELMTLLLENGARVDEANVNGTCILSCILLSGNYTFKMVEILLQYGAQPDFMTGSQKAPIHLIILSTSKHKWKCLDLMLKHGCDMNLKTKEKQTPLHLAVQMRDTISIGILLRAGANPNTVDCLGVSPFSHAFTTGRCNFLVFMLVDAGARMTGEEFEKMPVFSFTETQQKYLFKKFHNAMTLKERSRIAVWKLLGTATLDWLSTNHDLIPATLSKFLQFDDSDLCSIFEENDLNFGNYLDEELVQ